jgi:hypothetical protein
MLSRALGLYDSTRRSVCALYGVERYPAEPGVDSTVVTASHLLTRSQQCRHNSGSCTAGGPALAVAVGRCGPLARDDEMRRAAAGLDCPTW